MIAPGASDKLASAVITPGRKSLSVLPKRYLPTYSCHHRSKDSGSFKWSECSPTVVGPRVDGILYALFGEASSPTGHAQEADGYCR